MLAMLGAFALGFGAAAGGREALRASRLGARLGPAAGLLTALVTGGVLATGAVYAVSLWLVGVLPTGFLPTGTALAISAALVIGAMLHLALLRAPPAPKEPTRSFIAILTVLTVTQSIDPARLLLASLILADGAGLFATGGGYGLLALAIGMGACAAMLAACIAGAAWEQRFGLRFWKGGLLALCAGLLLKLLGFW